MIKLGDLVKDKLTEFKGTAIARAEYLYGCVWVCVVPRGLHDDKPIEDAWFDEARLEVVIQKNREKRELSSSFRSYGGPMPSIPKRSVPHPNSHDEK
jgi:hypothetical protein